jgi:hypothetical protein
MKIIRVRHEDHFTVVRNRTIRDPRLSFKATGLLAYLLSLPDGATVSRAELVKAKTDGQDSIMTALRELKAAGYIEHEKVQDEYGMWRTETTIREVPEGQPKQPLRGNPATVPLRGNPAAGFSRSKGRSTLRDGARAAVPSVARCHVCEETATLQTLHGSWLCDSHFNIAATSLG